MQCGAFFLGMLMLKIFSQHDHAQHSFLACSCSTWSDLVYSVGQVTDGVGAAK